MTGCFCNFRPLVGYGGGSSDDDEENDIMQNKSREGSLPHERNSAEKEIMTEERRAKLREIEVNLKSTNSFTVFVPSKSTKKR